MTNLNTLFMRVGERFRKLGEDDITKVRKFLDALTTTPGNKKL